MKKTLKMGLLLSTAVVLSGTFVSTSSHSFDLLVYAQNEQSVEDIHSLMTQRGPVTEEQWNSIPTEDWMRYANEAGPTMYMDNIFYKAYNEHSGVFSSELNRIFSIMSEKYGVDADKYNVYVSNEFNAFHILSMAKYEDGSGNKLSEDLALKIGFKEGRATQLTREQAIERVNSNAEATSMKNNLFQMSGLSEAILNTIPEEAFFEAAVVHAMNNPLGGDYGTQIATFKKLYPKYFEENTLPKRLEPMTREQAEEAAKSYFEAQMRGVLLNEGVTDEMLLRAPADAVYKAAVAYNMTYATGGDPGVKLRFFKQMYPEVFAEDAKPISEEERQAKVDKLVENKKRLSDFATQNKENADKNPLEVGEIFELENGKYEVSSIFLLQPKEAGNQSEDKKMLSIRYEYTNTTEEEVNPNDVASEIQSLTSLTQTSEGESVSLPEATYEFKDEDETETVEEVLMVKPGETITGGLYFEVDNHEDKLQLLVIKGDSIEAFDIDGNELFKLPLASASYVSTDNEPMAYILDFDKVYLVYPNQADTTQWDSIEHTSNEIQVDQLSKEAKAQYKLLSSNNDLTNAVLVELNHLSYKVNGDNIEAYLKDNDSKVLDFTTPDNWGQLVDGNNNRYQLLR